MADSRINFPVRSYNSLELSQNSTTLIKKSSNIKLLEEIEYYKTLPASLQIYFARFISSIKWDDFFELELEYYCYPSLGEVLLRGGKKPDFWQKVFLFYKNYIEDYKKFKTKGNCEDIHRMLVEKTETEYQAYVQESNFPADFTLNNKKLKGFQAIWPRIKEYIIQNFTAGDFYFYHGDLSFANTLAGEHPGTGDIVLKFVDPRGSFGHTKFLGPAEYDLAKLRHSVYGGYEYLINDRFSLSYEENDYSLILWNYHSRTARECFDDAFKDYDLEKIKLIEGLLFVSMAARHAPNKDRQLAMILTGLEILNGFYERLGQDASD